MAETVHGVFGVFGGDNGGPEESGFQLIGTNEETGARFYELDGQQFSMGENGVNGLAQRKEKGLAPTT